MQLSLGPERSGCSQGSCLIVRLNSGCFEDDSVLRQGIGVDLLKPHQQPCVEGSSITGHCHCPVKEAVQGHRAKGLPRPLQSANKPGLDWGMSPGEAGWVSL